MRNQLRFINNLFRDQKPTVTVVYLGLFTIAALFRYTHVVRGDYMPWWDGVGWSYADVWISRAVELAYTDSTAGFSFAAEGMVFVPPMALLIKLFGMAGGMAWWTHFLVISSALIAPIAASTVFRVTRNEYGALLAGSMVAIDPLLRWFGVNGWSDSATMFFTALAFWTFAGAATKPTISRCSNFGAALAMLALSHTTWLWPCVFWVLAGWPLLVTRRRWLPDAVRATDENNDVHWLKCAVPIGSFFGALVIIVLLLSVIGGDGGHDKSSIPIFSVDSNNQRALVVSYDPSMVWAEWQPSDTIRVVLTKFIPVIPKQLASLIIGHVVNVIPGFAWLALLTATAAIVVGIRGNVYRRLSLWALAGLGILGFLILHPQVPSEPSIVAVFIVLILLWLFIPIARVLLFVSSPMLGLLLLYIGITTQHRHSNAFVYLLYLLAGIAVSLAIWEIARSVDWRSYLQSKIVKYAPAFVIGLPMLFLLTTSASELIRETVDQRSEIAYLKWLGRIAGPNDIVMTTGNVNPWEVQELTRRTVYYDIAHSARMVIDGTTELSTEDQAVRDRWRPGHEDEDQAQRRSLDKKASALVWRQAKVDHPNASSNLEILNRIRPAGATAWFYTPNRGEHPKTVTLQMMGESTYPIFALIPRLTSPADADRFAYALDDKPQKS